MQAENRKTENRKAAVYCRVAFTDETSLAHQRDSLSRMAAEKGFAGCTEYLDNGAGGLTLDRPALNRLTDDIRTGKIQTVFIKDPARISRDIMKESSWLKAAHGYGAEVIFANPGTGELDSLPDKIRNTMMEQKK